MTGKIIDGKAIAETIRQEITLEVEELTNQYGRPPGLAVVLVGEDPASQVYVRNKRGACQKAGIRSFDHNLPATLTQQELLNLLGELNANPHVDGILVQLPLPDHIDEGLVLESLNPRKDVDGFHPINVGKLVANRATLIACTPLGIIELLERTGVEIKGADTVVLGRSNIVGKPVALLLLHRHATITMCHTRTRALAEVTRRADVLIAAAGRPRLVTADMVKQGVVVIDVGVNRVDGKLVGDVDFESVVEKASAITPVPGGVGPMTITMLLRNTVTAFKDHQKA